MQLSCLSTGPVLLGLPCPVSPFGHRAGGHALTHGHTAKEVWGSKNAGCQLWPFVFIDPKLSWIPLKYLSHQWWCQKGSGTRDSRTNFPEVSQLRSGSMLEYRGNGFTLLPAKQLNFIKIQHKGTWVCFVTLFELTDQLVRNTNFVLWITSAWTESWKDYLWVKVIWSNKASWEQKTAKV